MKFWSWMLETHGKTSVKPLKLGLCPSHLPLPSLYREASTCFRCVWDAWNPTTHLKLTSVMALCMWQSLKPSCTCCQVFRGSNKFQIYFILCWDKTIEQLSHNWKNRSHPDLVLGNLYGHDWARGWTRELQRSLPISTILWFCELLKTTPCQLIWSHFRKATGSRKLGRTPLALAQLQHHIKGYYIELCGLCTGRHTGKLLSPRFWPLQRIQKPSELPHSSSLHACTLEVWLHVWLCSTTTQVLITVTLLHIQPW